MAKIATVWFNKTGTNTVYLKLNGKLHKTEVTIPRTHLISGHMLNDAVKKKLVEEAIRADLGCGVVIADNLKNYQHNGVRFQYGK
ncbi:hypothetical protein [Escherichia phage PJNS034]